MTTLYNDNDPRACAWMRALIDEGLISPGIIDERSIEQLAATDLAGIIRFHAFAGIAGWDYALQLAGWPGDRPVWTASLPCQAWSAAGKQKGTSDRRHVWPAYFRIVREFKPELIFGEQVPAAINLGWLDGIFTDLESEGYTCGSTVLASASVGAPNIRQRIYWMAESEQRTSERQRLHLEREARTTQGGAEERERIRINAGHGVDAGGMAESNGVHSKQSSRFGTGPGEAQIGGPHDQSPGCRENGRLANADGGQSSDGGIQRSGGHLQQPENKVAGRLGDDERARLEGRSIKSDGQEFPAIERASNQLGFWSEFRWHACSDGKQRRVPVEPAFFPLAPRLPGRVAMLKGFGNAINPQVAATFIRAYMSL